MGDCARILDTVLSDQLMKAPQSSKLGGALADAATLSSSRSQSVSTGMSPSTLLRCILHALKRLTCFAFHVQRL
jgi:hypothetical protein